MYLSIKILNTYEFIKTIKIFNNLPNAAAPMCRWFVCSSFNNEWSFVSRYKSAYWMHPQYSDTNSTMFALTFLLFLLLHKFKLSKINTLNTIK